MKQTLLFFLVLLFPLCAFTQNYTVQLQSGFFTPEEKLVNGESAELVNGRYYRFIQFYNIPTDEQRRDLEVKGVKILSYIPNYAYIASVAGGLDINAVNDGNIRSAVPVNGRNKKDELLTRKEYAGWALRGKGKIELTVMHYSDITTGQVAELLNLEGVEVLHQLREINACRIIISISEIDKIASLPYLHFLETAEPEPTPDNLVGRTDHRSNMLATDYTGGLKYDGTGMTVALNDDGVIGPHIDYQGRLIGQFTTSNSGNHGDHCAGTIFGAGNRNPTARGMAFGAKLGVYRVSGTYPSGYQAFDSITSHYVKYGTRLTSTSYSDGTNAGYTARAQLMDVQINAMPELSHVFSAGNAGSSFKTITGGHKQSKNCIAVGNLTYQDALASSSSRGPARDGRIKPEICAVGTDVNSTVNPDTYALKTGTSMSCPGVTGTLTQLYHAYKTLNGGANPPSALIKAAVMNTGDELGNPGPDFRHGYGRINARRALALLQGNKYMIDSVSQGVSKNHTIAVPANVAELRVMVYWHDKEATVGAIPALVNNLDLKVVTPTSQNVLPWILDTLTANLNVNAVQGVDMLNNVEQVTITSPAAGNYTVNVAGTMVPFGPQKYYVVYEFVTNEITLIYPTGGESIVPGVQETIRWDAYSGGTGNFTVQYSTNNGLNWTTLSSTVSSTQRHYNWTPSASIPVTGQALVRVSRGSLSDQSDAPFSIISVPSFLTVNWVCVDSMSVSYNPVPGATGYVVTKLGSTYMDSVGFSVTSSCVVKNINTSVAGWFSVHAVAANNCKGRRALAQPHSALPFNCVIPDDLGIAKFNTPDDKTVIDCQANALSQPVSIDIKNNSLSPMSNIDFRYTVNGGAPVMENYSGTIAAQATYTHTFAQPVVFSSPGTYVIKAWLVHALDVIHPNDTITWTKEIVHPIGVSLPYSENFDAFATCDTSAICELALCQLSAGWMNDKNFVDDQIDWRTYAGPTPSYVSDSTTGPVADYSGTPAGQYLYLEANDCPGKQANLISPCIDLTGLQNPKMNFAYHMYGSDMGELHVDVLSNGQWTNDVGSAIIGDQGNSWKTATVSLANYIGQIVNVRFRGKTGSGYKSDIALDAISIGDNLSVNNASSDMNVQVFPNPSEGVFNIVVSGVSATVEVSVMDMNGKMIQRQNLITSNGTARGSVQLADAASGVYFLTLTTPEGVINRKLVKF